MRNVPDFANLPDLPALRTLKERPQWVAWRHHKRTKLDGSEYTTKVPVNPHGGGHAAVDDPATWGSYDEAVSCALRRKLAGVGYVLTADDDIYGIDLDGVRDATGDLLDWVRKAIAFGETYAEVSPSGRGVRLFGLGKLGGTIKHQAAQVEIYEAGRYLTVTGDQIAGSADEIREAPKTLALLRARVDKAKAADAKKKPAKKAKGKKGAADPRADVDFFRAVNEAALAGLERWVPGLFPGATYQQGTGAWRVTSHELSRNLEEDLSLHPTGITDWGIDDLGSAPQGGGRYTAIDILIDYGGAPSAKAAAFWLCERLGITPESLGWSTISSVIEELNEIHAVLPIGASGKTRVVTFGEDENFPGRMTIVMAQSFDDFAALKNKYRHKFVDMNGEEQSIPLGSYWIASEHRRQYDRGQEFMPQHDGDANGKLNLWRGFGVQAIKPDGKSGAAGCEKFLDFTRKIICGGNEEHFEYLIKREATIVQKRIRTEVAVSLRSDEEGVGKGIYESAMRRLLGKAHAMHLTNPEHIIGKFNEHLGVLLRVTADEALFVGDPRHRNALFTSITEQDLTIEPKFIGAHNVRNYLNISLLSNAAHFIPVGPTARRFFGPTVSAERRGDFAYFDALLAELNDGGAEALLYHLLHEVDLRDFNVRAVPQTEELRRQRSLSLPPLESWWVGLLEEGVLWGAHPKKPDTAPSNAYERAGEIGQRPVRYPGLYDQARQIDARLKTAHYNENNLASFLKEHGCQPGIWVWRQRGWLFPPLAECRAKWEVRYPDWPWRDPTVTVWRAEGERQMDHRADWLDDIILALLGRHQVSAKLDEAAVKIEQLARDSRITRDDAAASLQRLLTNRQVSVDEDGTLRIVVPDVPE